MKTAFLLILGMLFTISAQADPWHGYTKITHIYPHYSGLNFMVDSPLPEISTCDGGRRFFISKSHPNYDTMVATLMIAFSSNKSVYLNLETRDSPTCAPSINRFMLSNQ